MEEIDLNKFKDVSIVQGILKKINQYKGEEISIMEVCGTHTNSILKSGLKDLLPKNIKLISGPGCPVCVTDQSYIDYAIELSKKENCIIATFGDLIRVPGTNSSIQKQKALGCDVRVVYSPLDAINIAIENNDKEVIFLAIGFETTAPIIALSIKMAKDKNIKNFNILNGLKTMPEAMRSLVLDKETKIDGFLCPGHVATIIGCDDFIKLSNEYSLPMVVCGFEVSDIVSSIYKLIQLKNSDDCMFDNTYSRLVKREGNENAKSILKMVFKESESQWRGLGNIEKTGLTLREEYKAFDIKEKIDLKIKKSKRNSGCICGDILRGLKEPKECKLFKNNCTPSNPMGPCMVSEEGTCSSYFKYS